MTRMFPRVRRLARQVGPLVAAAALAISATACAQIGIGGPPPAPTPSSSYTAQALRPGEDKVLHSYGWVDEKKGIARIPIDRAIDIIAQQGLPVRAASATHDPDQGRSIPSYSSSGTQNVEWLH